MVSSAEGVEIALLAGLSTCNSLVSNCKIADKACLSLVVCLLPPLHGTTAMARWLVCHLIPASASFHSFASLCQTCRQTNNHEPVER